jgi:hypothetical protein
VLAVFGAVGLALNIACYAYVPAATGAPAPAPGADVRLQLSSDGSAVLAASLGPRVTAVDGKLSSVSSDGSMVIAPSLVQIADGARQQWTGVGLVTVPAAYVAGVQARALDRKKSTIAGVVIAASLAALAVIVKNGSGNEPTGPGPGGGLSSRRRP